MKALKVNTSDASYEELKKVAEKCGFRISERRKHCRVETREGRWVTNIPRHNRIKRPTAKGIAGRFQEFGGTIIIS